MSILQRIRQKILDRDYYLSSHAEEELFNDALERPDIEHAILKGRIHKKLTEDARGTRYRIEGPARDERVMHVVCRFQTVGSLVIITIYADRRNCMICEFCEGETVKRSITKLHWFQGNLYMIEDVEAEVCPECGERYVHATVLDRIDAVLEREHAIKKNITVEVINLEEQYA